MKALRKPSLTLLWVARLYAFWALIFRLVRLIFYSSVPNTIISDHDVNSKVTTVVVYSGPTTSLLIEVVLLACLAFGLLMLHRTLGRMMVGIAAVGLLTISGYGVLHLVYSMATANSVSADLLHIKLPIILASFSCGAALMFANMWLALQPPGGTNKLDSDNSPPFASPRTY
jgi:hypothetical protein